MKVKRTIITAAILMAAVCLSAQNKSAGVNFSIWKGVSTQPLDSMQTTYANIGISSTMNHLNGVGINVLGGITHSSMNGLQLSGVFNLAKDNMQGVQISGITNVNGDNMTGLSASGLVNIIGDRAKGVLFSGLTNIAGDNTTGLVMSGLMNITGNKALGLQVSGLANITGKAFNGIMTSGFLNVTGEDINGVQIAGIGNIAANELKGAQIGICNYATKASGVQIGLINYYKDDMKGFQLGLVNATPRTKVQLMVYGGNTTQINAGVRFKNELFYTILGLGTHYLNLNNKFSGTASYRAGLFLPVYKGFSISCDLGYQHIETFKNKDEIIPKRLYALQGRVNLEYQFTQKFGIFATGGYGVTKRYNKPRNFDKGAIIEVGVILF